MIPDSQQKLTIRTRVITVSACIMELALEANLGAVPMQPYYDKWTVVYDHDLESLRARQIKNLVYNFAIFDDSAKASRFLTLVDRQEVEKQQDIISFFAGNIWAKKVVALNVAEVAKWLGEGHRIFVEGTDWWWQIDQDDLNTIRSNKDFAIESVPFATNEFYITQ